MTFDELLPRVLPSVDGCPDAVAIDAIIDAARAFAAGTLVWNYTAPPIRAVADTATYTLQIGAGQDLVRLLRIDMDGCEYPVAGGTYGRAAGRRQSGRTAIVTGGNDFSLNPTPSVDGHSIFTDIAVKPALGSNYWPDDLSEYAPDIAKGAVSTLLALPRREWTDQQLGVMQGNLFRSRVSTVALKVARGFGTAHQAARVCFK